MKNFVMTIKKEGIEENVEGAICNRDAVIAMIKNSKWGQTHTNLRLLSIGDFIIDSYLVVLVQAVYNKAGDADVYTLSFTAID